MDDLKDRRGYCQLKEEALDRTMWRNRFGRGFGPGVWQITDDDDHNERLKKNINQKTEYFKSHTTSTLCISTPKLVFLDLLI